MEETIKLILEKLNELQSDVNEVKSDIKDLKTDVAGLKTDVADLKKGQEEIKEHLMQLEAKNADRHINISSDLEKLSRDLTALEMITGKNLTDIAILKSIK